jgi:hypothetical protein
MKDALGHGSNGLHAGGVNKIGNLPVHPNALRTIQKNPWGASVKPQTGVSPTTGYMVSIQGRTQSPTSAALAGPQGASIIRDYARNNSDLLQKPDMHIGSWADETGRTHLDVSQNIPDRATAVQEGRRRNQQGIWDVARKKFIGTGGTGDAA